MIRRCVVTWKMIQLAMMTQCAPHSGPIQVGSAEANRERASTRAVIEQKCHRNCSSEFALSCSVIVISPAHIHLEECPCQRDVLLVRVGVAETAVIHHQGPGQAHL